MKRPFIFALVLLAFALIGCRKEEPPSSQTPSPAHAVVKQRPKIVAFGDSLTAGLGLVASETYPAQLQTLLDKAGYEYEVINAGVSGDTTSDGLRRLDWTLDEHVKIVVLELGANDILRGLPATLIKDNLNKMIESMKARGASVVLAGMEAPTNSGPEYRMEIHKLYQELADAQQLTFIPFILQGVAGSDTLNQEDLSHPNAKGAAILARNIFEAIRPLLTKPAAS